MQHTFQVIAEISPEHCQGQARMGNRTNGNKMPSRLQPIGAPGKTHHTRIILIVRGTTTIQEPQKLWAKGTRKDLDGIRDTETSVVPDSVLSLSIRVQEKQGSKWKQQLTPNIEVELGQSKAMY